VEQGALVTDDSEEGITKTHGPSEFSQPPYFNPRVEWVTDRRLEMCMSKSVRLLRQDDVLNFDWNWTRRRDHGEVTVFPFVKAVVLELCVRCIFIATALARIRLGTHHHHQKFVA